MRKQASVTRCETATSPGIEHADLSFEPVHRTVHQRFAQAHAGVGQQVTRREVVGAVQHDIDVLQQGFDVVGGHACLHGFDGDGRIQGAQALRRRFDFRHADAVIGMQDLALQIAAIDHVVVHQAQKSDAGGREIESGGRAEATGADHEHACARQFLLPFHADLRQAQMARIALEIIRILRGFDRQAGALPLLVTPGDRTQARITLRREILRRQHRTFAAAADQQDIGGRVGDHGVCVRFEFRPGNA